MADNKEKRPGDTYLSFMDGLVETLKFLIITILIWFIVGGGWNGLYDWYKRSRGEKPIGEIGERVGNRAFAFYCLSLIGWVIILVNFKGDLQPLIYLFLWTNLIFLFVTLIGFVYFWTNLNTVD
jgi:hypothetical protein